MKVNDYYKKRECEKKYVPSQEICTNNKRPMILGKVIREMCNMLSRNLSEKLILQYVRDQLVYDTEWFDYDWQKEKMQTYDYKCFSRFLSWWKKQNFIVAELQKKCCFVAEIGNAKNILETDADIICLKEKDSPVAIRIQFSAHHKSLAGKSNFTNSTTDLNNMIIKLQLEDEYPGIAVWDLSLKNGEDTDAALYPEFLEGDKAASNVHKIPYRSYYNNGGTFLREEFVAKMEEVLSEPIKENCYSCFYKDTCKVSTEIVKNESDSVREQYHIPQFVAEQEQVVEFGDGCMSVIAGPGSGKTATMIGRTCRMIASGIPSDYLLLLTFSREAANELAMRAEDLLDKWNLPQIKTVNALAYNILTANEKIFGRKFCLLTDDQRKEIIERMTDCMDPLNGFNYTVKDGPMGIVSQLDKRLSLYCADKEAFRNKYPDVKDDFYEFANEYQSIIETNGYIDFNEQVSLCTKYLRDYPEILNIYQRQYRYIMVDEFQDISCDQVELIYLLAGKKPNLVVVGDDDQNVYGFRGGTPKFLKEFEQRFEAKCVKLSQNFRSSKEIVAAAARVIQTNHDRIQKDIFSNNAGGKPPRVYQFNAKKDQVTAVNHCISTVLSEGYQLRNIAVLARKNVTLHEIERGIDYPAHLAKVFLRDDALVRYIYDVLSVFYETRYSEKACACLKKRWNKTVDRKVILEMFPYLEKEQSSTRIVTLLADSIEGTDSISYDDVLQLIEDTHTYEINKLYRRIDYMIRYNDERRATVPECDKITLITSHDSKGSEWKVVIVADANEYGNDADSVNLFYVAVTRPKELLCICKQAGSQTLLDASNIVSNK